MVECETSKIGIRQSRLLGPRIFAHFGILIVLLGFGAPFGGLIDLPVSFFLKNKMRLDPVALANFRLMAAAPLYCSFLFGFARDTWSPFGKGDRGILLIFGAVSACLYLGFAFVPVTYVILITALLLLTISFLFAASAQYGMTAAFGQQHRITGPISAMWNIFLSVPTIATFLLGGWLSDLMERFDPEKAIRMLFLTGAAFMACTSIFALWQPGSWLTIENAKRSTNQDTSLQALLRHTPIYTALGIWLLWSFAPGSSTPLQYYLQDILGSTDAAWGYWNAIFAISFIPTFLLYGLICRTRPFKTVLLWGTLAAIPQMTPLLLTHTLGSAFLAAVPIGLMGGFATAAYMDLIIRSCPSGLEGSVMMMSSGLYYAAVRFGDVFGTYVYASYGGVSACVFATTIVYACILVVLRFVPDALTTGTDN